MLGPHAAIWATAVEALLLGNPGYWRHWQGAELAHAHWRMTGNPTLALTVFQQTLAPLRDLQSLPVMRSVLGYLAAIGPEARGLRPLLQSVVDTDQRLIGSGGWCGIAEDDDYRDLAAVAIRAM
jgi:hypothetical protein